MIPVIIIIIVLLVFCFAPQNDRAAVAGFALVVSLVLGVVTIGLVGSVADNVTEEYPVEIITEDSTHVVLDGPRGLEGVNRSELIYKDNCEGYHYVYEEISQVVVGVPVYWDEYYISCEG